MYIRAVSRFSPGRVILLSLLATIAVGTVLLSLPFARTEYVSFLDLLFTATSVTCVTGLFTIPLSTFTTFGHMVIFVLMQIGGIGLITLTLFMMSLFMDLGLGTQLMAGQVFEFESWQNIKKLLLFTISLTVMLEVCGAFIIFLCIYPDFSLFRAIFLSCFHAVASFCDAGVTLFPDGMMPYFSNYPMLITTTFLMFFGGLGFITWRELFYYAYSWITKKRFTFSLHSKIIFSVASLLALSSALLFWMLERHNTLFFMTPMQTAVNAIFNAISFKSTGFSTVYASELQAATLLMIMIISFIGSSPYSTGSGIKITTFAILLATIKAALRGKHAVELSGRRIPLDQVYKAVSIIALGLLWILVVTFLLLMIEEQWDFLEILFETVSAFATLGLSTGITAQLSSLGKLLIMITMMVGRIGSLTFILALKKRQEAVEYSYPEERIMLG